MVRFDSRLEVRTFSSQTLAEYTTAFIQEAEATSRDEPGAVGRAMSAAGANVGSPECDDQCTSGPTGIQEQGIRNVVDARSNQR